MILIILLPLIVMTFSRKFLQFSYTESDRVFQTGQPGLDPRLEFDKENYSAK